MIDIYLIRHGESEVNVQHRRASWHEKRICGTNTWSELTEKGIDQSRTLGEYLKKCGPCFDRIYSSSTVRAQQTARYCLEEMGFEWPRIQVDHRITELDQGIWEGKVDCKTRTDDIKQNMDAMNWHFTPPEGESQYDVFCRANEFIEEKILGKEYENIAVFTHQNVIACLLTGLVGLDKNKIHEMELLHTSMTVLRYDENRLDTIVKGEIPHIMEMMSYE
ncbi:hypothetical protein GF361_01230 [Candidatus Woesearchaeota archaeon]|nr:hypothetical protein [Candidatus Woesearchaeota archaeon]